MDQDHLTAQIAQVLQHQQLQQPQDTQPAETRDLMLEPARVDVRKTLSHQSACWAEGLKKPEDDTTKRVKKPKEAARLAARAQEEQKENARLTAIAQQ